MGIQFGFGSNIVGSEIWRGFLDSNSRLELLLQLGAEGLSPSGVVWRNV
jgi:hypothetical protein